MLATLLKVVLIYLGKISVDGVLTTASLYLRYLYTCYVESCQTEGKSFSPISAAIPRESFCLVAALERGRAR